MTVELSAEQAKIFENNGISEDDLRYTVEEYRKRGVSDSEIQKKLNTKYEALNGAVVTPELKDKQGNTVTEASTDYATQKGEVKKRGVIHPVDFVKSLGKGFLRGTGSLGTALGKRYGNDIRKAMGKRPLTSYEIDNLYGKKLGLPEQGVAYKTGEVVGDVAPYFLLPETKVAGLGKWGNRLLSFGYQGGVGGLLPSVAENGFNLKQNAKDALIGAGTSIALGGALSKVGDKVARGARAKAIAERRSTPLSERMTPEQKQNAYNNRGLQKRLDEMKNNPNVINDENFYNGVDSLPEEQQKQFWQAQGKEYVAQKRSQIRQLQSDKKQAVDKINAERQKALQNDVSFYNPAKKVNKEYDKQVLKTQKEYNQKIKKVQDDIDLYAPEDDNLNLNKLKEDIKGERYDKTETTHEYTTNRHKNSYSRHLVEDDETYNIKEAQNELNKIISDIANKPENINDEAFMADIEQRFNGVMGKLEGMPDELKEEMQTKMGNAIKKAQRYNDYKYNPDKKAEIDREYQQQMNPQAETPTAGNEPPSNDVPPTGDVPSGEPAEPKNNTSKFIDTVNNSSLANDSIKGKMNATYQTITNKETLAKAQKIIDDDMQGAINRVLLQDKPSEVEIAMGEDLARRLQATGNPEDVETAIAILEKTASDLTKAGRTVQAARIWQALTPQGALLSYQKAIRANTPPQVQTVLDNLSEITNAVKNAQTAKEAEKILRSSLKDLAPQSKNKIVKELKSAYKNGTLDVDTLKNAVKKEFKIQELTPEKTKQIEQLAKNIQEAKTPRDREVATALLKREIEEVKPASLGRKISTLQASAQLLNPKTIERNLIGNGLYGATEDITQSLLATPIDKIMSLVTGERTLVPTNIGTQLKGLGRGTKFAWDDIINGIDTSANAGKYDLWGGRTFRDGGIGSALETAMNVALRLPDRAAYTAVYDEAVENMLRASGVKNVTREMIENAPQAIKDQANLEALQRTFQDDSRLAKAGQGLKNWLNLGKDFGFGDLILKYAKTPSNILDRGISYSPIGLGKGIYETVAPIVNKSMPFNQRVASMDLARGLMGTGIMGGGYGLTQLLPDTQGAREDKNRLRQNLMAQGNRPYSIPIGDKSYSYDWAVPISIPFSAGVNYNNGNGLVESVLSSMNTLTEQPLLQGLQTLAGGGLQNMPESAINTVAGMVNSFNPSLLRQTAQAMDPYYRETKDGTKGLGGKVKTQFNRLLSNIPVVSERLPIKYDVTGQPVSRGATVGERVFNSFFNPANVSNRPNNYALNKSMDIFNQTGESKALYPVVPNQVTIDGEKKVLTPKQRSEYQKELGQMTQDIRGNMFNDTDFTNMTAEEQAEEMDKYNKAVNNAIKFYMFNAQPSTYKGLTQDVIDGYFDNVGYRNR